MTHDGANPAPLNRDPRLAKKRDLDFASIERQEVRRRNMFRSTIFCFIDLGYNVALVDGLEWLDTKVGRCSVFCCRSCVG